MIARSVRRFVAFSFVVSLCAIAATAPSRASDPTTDAVPLPSPTACASITVAIGRELRADIVKKGDEFPFAITASLDPDVAVGERGTGVVEAVNEAKRGSKPADLRLRYRSFPSSGAGRELVGDQSDGTTYVAGGRNAIRGIFTNIPTIGTAMSIRNAVHRGRDLVVPSGATFCVRLRSEQPRTP